MTTTTLPVRGMTCRACEVRVGRAVRAVPGVREVRVSARRGTLRVDGDASRAAVERAVVAAGYEVGAEERSWLSRDRRVWSDVAVGTAAVVVVAVVAGLLGADRWTAGATQVLADGGLVVAVALGLAAGVSTCMALVGGLVLAAAARYAERRPTTTAGQRLRPHLLFHAGRVVGFAAGGALLGAAGSAVQVGAGTTALLVLVVGVAMAVVGLQLTGVSPRLAGWSVALPARLGRLGSRGPSGGTAGTVVLGAASFLLPCGFTQVVQLYALATGSPLRAGAVMALFAVGTAPGLLGLAGVTAAARGPRGTRVLRWAGVAVLAFSLVNVSGALTVLAPSTAARVDAGTPAVDAVLEDGVQVLRTTQVAGGYEPAHATVLAGVPVRWEVDSVAASCASALHAPAMGIGTVLLSPGVTTFTFTPDEPGVLPYSCAMGMYTGQIEVVAAEG